MQHRPCPKPESRYQREEAGELQRNEQKCHDGDDDGAHVRRPVEPDREEETDEQDVLEP